jgi:hypothetical protein
MKEREEKLPSSNTQRKKFRLADEKHMFLSRVQRWQSLWNEIIWLSQTFCF